MHRLLLPLLLLALLSCQSHQPTTIPASTATFYTTPCNQRRIVFIISHMGSMLDTFDFLRQDTTKTINSLDEKQSFNIIMFSEDSTPLFPTLQTATLQNKQTAAAKLQTFRAQGMNCADLTPTKKSFQLALAQHPDAIFFVTDGNCVDPDTLPALIKTLDAHSQTPVHTFLYTTNNDDTQKLLQQIATESHGTFKIVSYKDLGK